MPVTLLILLPTNPSLINFKIGIPPATAASKEKNKLFFSAKSANSFPCLATNALFAVITDLLLFRAEKQRSFAIPSSPPISSMITSISSDLLIKTASSKKGMFEKSIFLFLLLDFAEIPHSLRTNSSL